MRKVAIEVGKAIHLEEDCILEEVATSSGRAEAVRRLKTMQHDLELALDVVLAYRERKGARHG